MMFFFLGLPPGQAKDADFADVAAIKLDEWIPVLEGTEINDDPITPVTKTGQSDRSPILGDNAKIEWALHRDDRSITEKLATPDVTIADLIGEIDLVKHAEGRYLSDDSTMHYGLIPRSNRGIFAINELRGFGASRIQVGLFNVLEERDVCRFAGIQFGWSWMSVWCSTPRTREDYTPIAGGL